MSKISIIGKAPIIYTPLPHTKSVSMGILVRSGSITETSKQMGYAHFTEHMVFKGTSEFSYKEINQQFEKLGAYTNAFTDKYYTMYYVHVLEEHYLKALKLLLSIVFDAVFLETELEKEKQVIIEEIEDYKDSPDDCLVEMFYQKTFAQSFLANPILGTKENIEATTREELYQYYKEHYYQDNVIFSFAGNFNPDDIEEMLKTTPMPQKTLDTVANPAPAFHAHCTAGQQKLEQAYFLLGIETESLHSTQKESMILWSMILGEMTSSRLYNTIREEMGLCYNIGSYTYFDPYLGMINIAGSTQPKNITPLLTAIEQSLNDMKTKPPAEEELTIAKNQICAHLVFKQESVRNVMMSQARHWLFYGELMNTETKYKQFQSVTLAHLNGISDTVLNPKAKRCLAVLSTENLLTQTPNIVQ